MDSFENIAIEQGWNEETQLSVILEFIYKHDLDAALAEHASDQAQNENEGF